MHSSKTVLQQFKEGIKDLKPYEDVIISIGFYRPFSYSRGLRNYGLRFAEEFLVLGSNTLVELRDKINCIANNRCPYDISEDPDVETPIPKHNSGLFFISNTFYNDYRNPANLDYSEVITELLKGRSCFESAEFKTAIMEETTFIDLTVEFGYPQVYMHQGNCEHVSTFSWIQLLPLQHHLKKKESYYYVNDVKVGEFEAYKLKPDELLDVIPVDDEEATM